MEEIDVLSLFVELLSSKLSTIFYNQRYSQKNNNKCDYSIINIGALNGLIKLSNSDSSEVNRFTAMALYQHEENKAKIVKLNGLN